MDNMKESRIALAVSAEKNAKEKVEETQVRKFEILMIQFQRKVFQMRSEDFLKEINLFW